MKGFKKMFINQHFKAKPKPKAVYKKPKRKAFKYKYPVPFPFKPGMSPWITLKKRRYERDLRNARRMLRTKLPEDLSKRVAQFLPWRF